MLSIITSVIFFGNLVAQLYFSVRYHQLVNLLEERNIYVSKWNRHAAIKDLKKILRATGNDRVKEIVTKILAMRKIGVWTFFGTIILLVLLFTCNGIFNWQL
jgi:hypothetical protein